MNRRDLVTALAERTEMLWGKAVPEQLPGLEQVCVFGEGKALFRFRFLIPDFQFVDVAEAVFVQQAPFHEEGAVEVFQGLLGPVAAPVTFGQ